MSQFGSRSTFAIDCEIASLHPPRQALGKFVVYLAGRRFGVDEREATMLGNSIESIEARIANRGFHRGHYLERMAAADVANSYLGEFRESGTAGRIAKWPAEASSVIWAPDGDAAFDDSSHILQMDIGGAVRILGFVNYGSELADGDVVDLVLLADVYYGALQQCAIWYRESLQPS